MRYCGSCGEPVLDEEGKKTHTVPVRPPTIPKAVWAAMRIGRVCPTEVVIDAAGGKPAVIRSHRLARVLREREASR